MEIPADLSTMRHRHRPTDSVLVQWLRDDEIEQVVAIVRGASNRARTRASIGKLTGCDSIAYAHIVADADQLDELGSRIVAAMLASHADGRSL